MQLGPKYLSWVNFTVNIYCFERYKYKGNQKKSSLKPLIHFIKTDNFLEKDTISMIVHLLPVWNEGSNEKINKPPNYFVVILQKYIFLYTSTNRYFQFIFFCALKHISQN